MSPNRRYFFQTWEREPDQPCGEFVDHRREGNDFDARFEDQHGRLYYTFTGDVPDDYGDSVEIPSDLCIPVLFIRIT